MAWDGAIAGYNRVRAAEDASSLAELQRASAAQGLVKSAIEQEAAAKNRQREGEFRAKLSQLGENPTHEQVRALALQSGLVAPKDMLSNDLGMYKADASKELALSRLALQKQNHDQQYELAKRKVANAEQAAQLDAWYKSGNMAIRTAMARYGLPSDIFDGASIPAAPTAQPAPQPEVLPSGTLAKGVTRSAVSPQDLEAMRVSAPADYAAIMGAQQTPEPTALNTLRGAPSPVVVSPSPIPAPTSQPVPPAVLQPKPQTQEIGENEDMRDVIARRARDAQPSPPPVPLSAMDGAPKSPGGYPLSRKDMAKGQNSTMTPETRKASVDFWANVMLNGGTLPPGLAKNREGADLVKEIMAKVATGGVDPKEMLSRSAEFQGQKAGQRTLSTRIANIEMAATEAANLMPIAIKASENVNRTNYPSLNSVILAMEKGTGDANVVQLAVATNSLVNAYSRAISPSGTPTVSDKDHAREILASAYSKGQYASAVRMMQQEIDAARKSPHQVRGAMKEEFTGKPSENKGGGKDTWKDL